MPRARPDLTLDAQKIIETIARLQRRITERFPGAGLAAVCDELQVLAHESSARAQRIARRHMLLRLALVAIAVCGVALLVWVLRQIDFSRTTADDSLYSVFQGIEAVANLLVLTGGIFVFLITIEQRLKRRRALAALHELRALVHVIDMHQLTKDPSTIVSVGGKTPSSPARTLTPYELSRYLDYCAEMMSLTSKIAVLYAQSFPDVIVTDAVSDIERIASGMAQKIWQKIVMLDPLIRAVPATGPTSMPKLAPAPTPAPAASEDGAREDALIEDGVRPLAAG
ncbi:MAG TPA: hypothetical protein VFZ16_08650 [Hyphomicrobiaceae bacterium]|nr:hypothetical protein [Hyphomicrobiaceae bacterium]